MLWLFWGKLCWPIRDGLFNLQFNLYDLQLVF
jgi:hypothetical protein